METTQLVRHSSGLFKEFREFAVRGNVIDLAVGIIIGGAFQPIVNSIVNDLIMPPIGMAMGNMDFKERFVLLKDGTKPGTGLDGAYATVAEAKASGAVTLNYGNFAGTVINFIIVAFAVFLLVKFINRMRRKEAATPPPPAPPTKQEILLEEIRDLLKKGSGRGTIGERL